MRKAYRSDVQDTEGIKTLPQNRWEIVSWSELSDYMKGSLWDVYDISYGSIGKHVPDIKRFGEKYKYLFLIDVDEDVKPDAFIAYKKTHAGYKIALGGTDGTRPAKKAMILKMKELIRKPGWYAEGSGKVADILESAGMRPIDDEEVVRKTLKGKEIEWLGDGKYSRQLGKSSISAAKSLYGTPKVAMQLSVARRLVAGENEPTKPDLWAKVQALAKGEKASITVGGKKVNGPNDGKGFDVFPSAYANGWASKVYKDLGGGWKKKAHFFDDRGPGRPYDRPPSSWKTNPFEGYRKGEVVRLPGMGDFDGPLGADAFEVVSVGGSEVGQGQTFLRSVEQGGGRDFVYDPTGGMFYLARYEDGTPREERKKPVKKVKRLNRRMSSRILAGLKSASAKLKWEPTHDYWDGTKRVLKQVAQSRDHQWEIRRTGEHPQLGMAHKMKRSWVKVFRDGKQFGKPHGSIRAAQRHVQEWVDEYERRAILAVADAWGPTLREGRGKAKKDVGHGGLDEWFSGHGGAKGKGEDATWGDWVSISPVKKTLDSGKKVEPGDIVGPCGISDDPDWKDITKDGKDPLKCMPREKAYDMGKKERAEKAKAKQKAEKADSNRGKKPTHTPTFKKEKKEKKASLSERVAAKYQNKRKVPRRDGKGETTIYEYSEGQVKARNRAKAERVEKLRGKLGDLRKQVKKDLASDDPKKKLTALAVSVIDETFERVGNEGSAKEGHFGVTTLLKKHLKFDGGKARLQYVGKSGVKHDKTITNKAVVSLLKEISSSKGAEDLLFCDGDDCVVRARDVNAYLKPFEVTAKDLRGLHANEQMKAALKDYRKAGPSLPKDKKEREKILKEEFKKALEQAAAAVGHQASTLKSQYLVPGMEDAYLKDGTVLESLSKKATLSDTEKEDRETERQVRKSPKAKPPRRDLERRRIDLDSEEDPDTKQDKKDRSNNYKDAHGRLLASWGTLLTARGPMPLEPGKVRKTDKGRYTGMNSEGATHTFDDEADAKAFAKGEDAESGSDDSDASKEDADLTGKRDALMKKYRDMGLLDEGTLKSIEELAQDAKSTADLEELADMAQQEADEAKAKKDEQKAREESAAAEKAKEKKIKDVSSLFKGGWSAESNVSEVLEDLSEKDYEAFAKALESKSEDLLKNPPKPAEIPDIIEDAKKIKEMADRESQVKSLAKDVAKLADALAKVKYHEEVLDNPLVDSDNPLPKEGDDLDLESRVDRSKRAMEKYLEMDSEDRKRHFDRLQNEAERATGARKEAIEAVMQGIGIASVLQEGMEAKGVAGATSRLIQAAHKTGKIDKILEMPRKSDSPEQRAKDQKLIREVYEGLREEEWLDVIPEGHPGRGLADILADPMGKGRFLSWDDKADIRARLSDMLIAETSFLDPALNESMGDATTAKYDEEAKKHRSQAAGADLILEEGDDVKEKVGSWTEKFTSGLAALVAKLRGKKAPEGEGEERSPGTVWGEPGELYAKSPEGEQRGPFDNREKADAWARGETPNKQASWHFEAWPANIFQ